jgi:ribonuclease PH
VELGQTKVLATLHGPHRGDPELGFSDEGRVNVFFKFAAGAAREPRLTAAGAPAAAPAARMDPATEVPLAASVREALLPSLLSPFLKKQQLDLHLLCLCDDAGLLPASLLACSLLLAAAGFPLTDLTASIQVAVHASPPLYVLDPTAAEAAAAACVCTAAYLPSLGEFSHFEADGPLPAAAEAKVRRLVAEAAGKQGEMLRACLEGRAGGGDRRASFDGGE